jgi:hypothetical protein
MVVLGRMIGDALTAPDGPLGVPVR